MEVTLVVIRGKVNRGEITFQPPAVLGRSREADLTIAHPMVSRHHCELFEVDGLLMIRDLGSLNGTMVHGRRVVQAALCPDEDFSVGPLTFQVRYQYDGDLNNVPPPTLAEPIKADQPGRSESTGPSPQSTETPELSGIAPESTGEPAAEPAVESGPWSNAVPAEDESPWSNAVPANGPAAEPAEEMPQFEPLGELSPEEPTGMLSAEVESPAPSFPAEEFVPAAPVEDIEDAGMADDDEEPEPEPEKKRGFRLWPFGGGKRSASGAKRDKSTPEPPAASPVEEPTPPVPSETLSIGAGNDDTPHDAAVADFLMSPDAESEEDAEPEAEAEAEAEPDEPQVPEPAEPSDDEDGLQDFLKRH